MFNQYPYLNLNDLNLDYILKAIKEMRYEVTNFVSINAIKYADPIQWDITRQYEKNTVVIDPLTGTAYISVQPVPSGVALTREEYWTVVFDLGSFVTRAARNLARKYEPDTTLTATFNTSFGEWLIWGDVLYVAQQNINVGDAYVVDGNIRHITIEEVKDTIFTTFNTMIGDLNLLATSDKTSVVNAINEVVNIVIATIANTAHNFTFHNEPSDSATATIASNAGDWLSRADILYVVTNNIAIGDAYVVGGNINRMCVEDAINGLSTEIHNTIGALADLSTTDKSNIVNAINEIFTDVSNVISEIGDLSTLVTNYKNTIVGAINEVVKGDISNRKFILVSDSYGEAPSLATSWCTYFLQYSSATGDIFPYSAAGFNVGGGNTILSRFQNETISNKESYTDIIACLGANDGAFNNNSTLATLKSNIKDFITYCKTNFPNAKISIGYIGGYLFTTTHAGTSTPNTVFNVIRTYQEAAAETGVGYLGNVETILHMYNLLSADGVHPNVFGSYFLARAIVQAYLCGACNNESEVFSLDVTPVSGVTINGQSTLTGLGFLNFVGLVLNAEPWTFTLDYATPQTISSGVWYKIGDIYPIYLIGNGIDVLIETTAECIHSTPAVLEDIPFIIKIRDKEIFIKSKATGRPLDFTKIIFEIGNRTYSVMFN